MAREAFQFVGAAIGFVVGGPAGAALGAQIGGLVGNIVDPVEQEGPRLSDLSVSASTYGQPIPLIYGHENRVAGNVIWSTKLKEHEKESGGKGGPTTTEYTYSISFAVAVGEGKIHSVRKVWANSKVIFDADDLDNPPVVSPTEGMVVFGAGDDALANKLAANETGGAFLDGAPFTTMRFYQGTGVQVQDPTIEAHKGSDDTPAYRHTAYVVFEDLQLADFGNAMPSIEVEVAAGFTDHSQEHIVVFSEVTAPGGDPHIWTPPAGIHNNEVDVLIVGGGGQGGTSNWPLAVSYAGGGGGGGGVRILGADTDRYTVTPGSPIEIRVGHGGNSDDISANGGDSSFAEIVAPGGGEGGSANPANPGVDGAGGGGGAAGYDASTSAHTQSAGGGGTNSWGFAGGAGTVVGDHGIPTHPNALEFLGGGGGGSGRWVEDPDDGWVPVVDGTGNILEPGVGGMGRASAIPEWIQRLGYDGFGGGGGGALADFNGPAKTGGIGGGGTGCVFTPSLGGIGTVISQATDGSAPGGGGGGKFPNDNPALDAGADPTKGRGAAGIVAIRYFTIVEQDPEEPPTVGAVVRDIASRGGLESPDISTAALTQILRGYVIARQGPAASALAPLATAYDFDVAEQGGQIRCIPRGRGLKAVIPLAEMGAVEGAGGDRPEPIRYDTASDLEMPREVAVSYADPDEAYQVNTQRANRREGHARNNISKELPLTLGRDHVRRTADRLLWEAWAARQAARFALSDRWHRLDPAAVLGLPVAGGIVPHRLIRASRGHNGVLEIEARREDPELYTSLAAGAAGEIIESEFQEPGETRLLVFDAPMLRSGDGNVAFYWAVTSDAEGWRGAQVYRSLDDESYQLVAPVSVRTVIGDVATPLPAGPSHIWDRGNSLTVELHYAEDELEGRSELDVLNGANAAWLGNADGTGGEIIQFATAELVSAGTYELRDLLRGRLGTERNIAAHGADEVFVLLETESLGSRELGHNEVDRDVFWRAVTNLTAPDDANKITANMAGVAQRPLSPVHIDGARDGANDLTISWFRRSRLPVPGLGRGPVPLGEETESYEIDILAGSPQAVVRTLTATTTSVEYTAAQQTADGLTPGDPVDVAVYQMSGVVGRGFPGRATV